MKSIKFLLHGMMPNNIPVYFLKSERLMIRRRRSQTRRRGDNKMSNFMLSWVKNHGIPKFEAGRRENFKRSSTKFSPGNDIPIVNIGDEDVKTSRDCGELNTTKDCREVFDPNTD